MKPPTYVADKWIVAAWRPKITSLSPDQSNLENKGLINNYYQRFWVELTQYTGPAQCTDIENMKFSEHENSKLYGHSWIQHKNQRLSNST